MSIWESPRHLPCRSWEGRFLTNSAESIWQPKWWGRRELGGGDAGQRHHYQLASLKRYYNTLESESETGIRQSTGFYIPMEKRLSLSAVQLGYHSHHLPIVAKHSRLLRPGLRYASLVRKHLGRRMPRGGRAGPGRIPGRWSKVSVVWSLCWGSRKFAR